jgi:UDP-N-acetylmuramyl pentapeptide synthase
MNELGNFSEAAHTEIGGLCDPKQLDLLVTIGPDANEFLAKAAESKGCKVERFNNPYKAGEFLKPLVKEDAVILVKGSQNKVFAEEAIKSLLKNHKDEESQANSGMDEDKIQGF